MGYHFAGPATRRISDDRIKFKAFDLRPGFWTLRFSTRSSTSTIGGIEKTKGVRTIY